MVFSSPIFLFLFLPAFLFIYFSFSLLQGRFTPPSQSQFFSMLGNVFILLASLLFYFWGESWLVLIMLGSTVIDYVCGLAIGHSSDRRYRLALLVFSVAANLGLLGLFKYGNFTIDNINALADAIGLQEWRLDDVIRVTLPLGISFYTFQSMSYTIDVYRREVEPTRNFFNFACFVTMFPQLVAGPIVRYRDVALQIVERRVSREAFASGVLRFICGLAKKVLIANTVAVPADRIFALSPGQLTPGLAWLGIVCYTLQIYFDFSGYSDMAIGLGRMLGFHFPENFNYPYFARSIQEFWRRWHISLSTWFRDYLYVPLGGNRQGGGRTYVNLVAVFLLCGLWHGAAWNFVVWGLYHGVFLVVERLGLGAWLSRRHPLMVHPYVLLTVMGGWVLFRSETLGFAVSYFAALAGFAGGDGLLWNVPLLLTDDVLVALVTGATLSWPLIPGLRLWRDRLRTTLQGPLIPAFDLSCATMKVFTVTALAFFSSMSISGSAYNPFIYFRF